MESSSVGGDKANSRRTKTMRQILSWSVILLLTLAQAASAQSGSLTVDLAHPGVKISPMLYGLMTEEINHSYDGGLYAELIQNRTFSDSPKNTLHWSLVKSGASDAKIELDERNPVNDAALKRSLRLDVTTAGDRVGIANDGYWGIPAWPHTKYMVSFYAKANPGFSGSITCSIENNDGTKVFATATVPSIGGTWKKYEVTLATEDIPASATNRFVISTKNPGSIWFSLVSLFPPTYKDRANGSRIDLMQKLADMHTAFLRLPGGNYLEGNTIAERFNWEKTLGNLEDRPGHQGPWGYPSTDGLGLLEFYGWCEDLKIQPLLAVFAGYALRGEHIAAGPALIPFVQEALDEIEYTLGDQTTKWGQRRAKDGHSEPFDVKYIEIGNEDFFDRSGSYDGRFAQFYDAIKAKYPQLQLIATTPVKSRTPDLVDDHFYRSARAMERDIHHYDKISRTGPKIFVGEWATQEGVPTPDMNAAVGDAAWLTGLEKNSDVVLMSCYAPLLVNVNRGARQWPTNLIGYDAVSSFVSPSYYAQKMFYENRGDTVLPVEIVSPKVDPASMALPHGGVGVGTWRTVAEFKDLKVTSGEKALYTSDFSKGTSDLRTRGGTWEVRDGAFRQTGNQENVFATVGDTAWGDYTYSIKARKISGTEGFLVLFHAVDRRNYFWFNIGGWGNTRTGLERVDDGEKSEFGQSQQVTIDTGKWYDIRVEVNGHDIKCYLDDKLVSQGTESSVPPDALIATASRLDSNGQIVLKVVNTSPTTQPIQINVRGAASVASKAFAQVLTGNPTDVNTVDSPDKIVPQEIGITNAGTTFIHEFPATSVTVIRLEAK
jgi:alpha-L-arabinofuranosidase